LYSAKKFIDKSTKIVPVQSLALNVLELYSGSGSIGKAFEANGHNVLSIDNRFRKGTCEPNLKANIMKLTHQDLLNAFNIKYPDHNHIDIIWASVPCQVWSHAAGNTHFRDNLKNSEGAEESIKLLKKTLKLITEISPALYFIENPRGHLRYWKPIIDWLVVNNGMIKQTTWGSYGFPTPKPTNIFTNAHSFKLKEMQPFGRGAKSISYFNKMTVVQRQTIPQAFSQDLVNYCQNNLPGSL
jgi:hypothetical protein